MDFSFLEDPQWIRQREEQWMLYEERIKQGLPKNRFQKIKNYFFSGEIKRPNDVTLESIVEYFPRIDVEGLTYCLRNNVQSGLSNEKILSLQRILAATGFDHLSEDEKRELFLYTFGETYDPSRKFPFLIGESDESLPVVVGPDYFLACGLRPCSVRCLIVERPITFWFDNAPFFFSLFDYVDPATFSVGEVERFYSVDGIRIADNNEALKELMAFALDNPPTVFEGVGQEEVQSFLDSLKGYLEAGKGPAGLNKLWQHIKQDHSA